TGIVRRAIGSQRQGNRGPRVAKDVISVFTIFVVAARGTHEDVIASAAIYDVVLWRASEVVIAVAAINDARQAGDRAEIDVVVTAERAHIESVEAGANRHRSACSRHGRRGGSDGIDTVVAQDA